MKTMKIISRGLSLGCGGYDRTLIACQQLEPVIQVSCRIATRIMRHPEICAEERCGQFRDELLGGVGVGSEPASHIAVKATLDPRPVTKLVQERRIEMNFVQEALPRW